ncbi:MAG: hypothetical protein AAF830_09985 [Pseudomonadota bacterium]
METMLSEPDTVIKKSKFAQELGVSRSRVTQLVERGLPTTEDGLVPLEEGRRWYEQNIGPSRRKIAPASSARAELDKLKAERERLKIAQIKGELIPRDVASRVVFERARMERDSWTAFASRVSATIAMETGADQSKLFAALDREVRAQLQELADEPLDQTIDE